MAMLPKVLGLGFRVGATVALRPTARLASKVFLTPLPRMGPSEWPEELDAKVVASELKVTGHAFGGRFLSGPTQHTIKTWVIGESDKRVVVCHGWGGNGSNFLKFIPKLLAAGFEVHTFDGPSHGDGVRGPTALVDFVKVLEALQERYGPYTAAVGHSFGAGSTAFALGRSFAVDRAVLLAPMVDSEAATEYFCDQIDANAKLRKAMHKELLQMFSEYSDAWNLATYAKGHTTQAKIFHDPTDHRVPYDCAVALAENWTNASMVTTEGLTHHSIMKDDDVIDQTVEFLLS